MNLKEGAFTLEELERQMFQQRISLEQQSKQPAQRLPQIPQTATTNSGSVWSWDGNLGGIGWGNSGLPGLPQLPQQQQQQTSNSYPFRDNNMMPTSNRLPSLPTPLPSPQLVVNNQSTNTIRFLPPLQQQQQLPNNQLLSQQQHQLFLQQQQQNPHLSSLPKIPTQNMKSNPVSTHNIITPLIPSSKPRNPAYDNSNVQPIHVTHSKLDLTNKSEARSRFEWQGVGTMDVRPNVTGPDEYIDVSWELPAKSVSRETLLNATSHSRRNNNSHNNNQDSNHDSTVGDWIGMFRARQRVDDATGFILTRETTGRATYDNRTDTIRGRVRLRAPRGVGTYDFRYFSASSLPFNAESEQMDQLHRLPLARSSTLTVEVQGSALFEALQFIEKNIRDKKRLAAAAQQLATLIRQIKTLRTPLQGHSNQNKRVLEEVSQENRLNEELWKVVFSCLERGTQLDEQLSEQANEIKLKIEEAKASFDEVCKAIVELKGLSESVVVGRLTEEDDDALSDSEILQVTEPNSPGKHEEDPAEELKRNKRQAWVLARRDAAQLERDRASVGSAVKGVIDDLRQNAYLYSLLDGERRKTISSFNRRYSAMDERFFLSEEALIAFAKTEWNISRWSTAHENGRIGLDINRVNLLEGEISRLIPSLVPNKTFFDERRALIQRLQMLLDAEFTKKYGPCRLTPFGSSANSFGGPNSDLDLCLVLLERKQQHSSDSTSTEGTDIVELVGQILTKSGYVDVDDSRKTARIPIVQFRDPSSNIECDICVNNPLAIRNTLLLRTYGSVDDRARLLVFLVKHWAKKRNLNDPSSHTLSSYGWILLVINYMQRVGLLPVLQEIPIKVGQQEFFPSVPSTGADGKVHDTYFFGDPESTYFATMEAKERAAYEARKKSSTCTLTVAELLAGFYWDLAFTDWRRNVASIRCGDFILKSIKAAEDSWRLHPRCSIEDPFETSYDVGHVLRDSTFKKIRLEAARGYALLTGCYEGFVDVNPTICFEELITEIPIVSLPDSENQEE